MPVLLLLGLRLRFDGVSITRCCLCRGTYVYVGGRAPRWLELGCVRCARAMGGMCMEMERRRRLRRIVLAIRSRVGVEI